MPDEQSEDRLASSPSILAERLCQFGAAWKRHDDGPRGKSCERCHMRLCCSLVVRCHSGRTALLGGRTSRSARATRRDPGRAEKAPALRRSGRRRASARAYALTCGSRNASAACASSRSTAALRSYVSGCRRAAACRRRDARVHGEPDHDKGHNDYPQHQDRQKHRSRP